MTPTYYTTIDSPLGPVLVAGNGEGLKVVNFQHGSGARRPDAAWVRGEEGPVGAAATQLREYFAGTRSRFDLPLAPQGTAFQQAVWRGLLGIPYGQTISYGELARRLGKPTASRAVGAANGRNPLPIVIPCHRVIGSTGKLTGFYGGLHLKEGLLALERRADAPAAASAQH